ncbi:MAG: response regulator transcription factor [Actinomycetota bacterium]|nr:response regulator transcription factor [Actinomycetota bacterium]
MTPDVAKIRVFLLDDHELVRRGLRDYLSDECDFEIVGEAGSVREALAEIPGTDPDVAVVDVRLPDGSGIELCREVRSSMPSVRCLILTSFPDEEAFTQAVLAGASAWVLKETKTAQLVDAIRHVAGGGSMLDSAMTPKIFDGMRSEHARRAVDKLSRQERQILELIVEGLSNREIAKRLFLAEQTVKNYVSRLLAKLGVDRRTQAAVIGLRETGFRQTPDPSAHA